MTIHAVYLLSLLLLLLCCYGNWLFVGLQLAAHSTQADIPETTTDHQEGHSADPDDKAHLRSRIGSKSSARSPRSTCQRLGRFLTCYAVIPEVLPGIFLGADGSGSPAEMPVSMAALGRRFSLRLRVDDLSGEGDGSRATWSSVISPSAIVRVIGEGDNNVNEHRPFDDGITWYVGHDAFEVAPSSVLASVVNMNDTHLFRAVIRTMSNNYYVEPASDYPEVERTFTWLCTYLGVHYLKRIDLIFGMRVTTENSYFLLDGVRPDLPTKRLFADICQSI